MKIAKLFLPVALLCSISSQQLLSMSEEPSEFMWIKDQTFPVPQGSKKTKSRWIAVPAEQNVLHSQLQESVNLGQISDDEFETAKFNIEKAFQQTNVMTPEETIAYYGKYTPVVFQAAITAAIKREERGQQQWKSLQQSEIKKTEANSSQSMTVAHHPLVSAHIAELEQKQDRKQKSIFLAMLASYETPRIIELEEELAQLNPQYVRKYKTVDQVKQEKQARESQARKSWWSLFTRSSK